MSFIILLAGIILLILLITWAKLNAFLAFLIVSILIGLCNGLNLESAASAMEKGIGNILGSLSIILCMGAIAFEASTKSAGTPPYTTGAPSELTCAQATCHDGVTSKVV